jgi:predicted nucleic acid-binding Zn ribbon protein
MPTAFDDDEEDFDEREYPDDEEADWNLDPATDKCPYCGGEIVEDSQWCPHCDKYISQEDAPRRKSIWIIGLVIILAIVAVFLFW